MSLLPTTGVGSIRALQPKAPDPAGSGAGRACAALPGGNAAAPRPGASGGALLQRFIDGQKATAQYDAEPLNELQAQLLSDSDADDDGDRVLEALVRARTGVDDLPLDPSACDALEAQLRQQVECCHALLSFVPAEVHDLLRA